MGLLLGSYTLGLILAILAIGILISFRIFNVADITAEGSFTLGAACAAALISSGAMNPFTALAVSTLAGAAAGCVTGVLHTKFKINALLAAILVMTALYSVNLHVMGKSNVTLNEGQSIFGFLNFTRAEPFHFMNYAVTPSDLSAFIVSFVITAACGIALTLFLGTQIGTALRATGDNRQMAAALGIDTDLMVIMGLAAANALAALSGALLAQYQGFSDVQMGIGMLVWGLASVILGETLVREKTIGLRIAAVALGSIFFRLLVALALRFGMNPNDMKLVTAIFVLAALILPELYKKKTERKIVKAN